MAKYWFTDSFKLIVDYIIGFDTMGKFVKFYFTD